MLRVSAAALLSALLLGGCVGQIMAGGEDDNGGDTANDGALVKAYDSEALCAEIGDRISPGPAPIRRVTRAEYNNTIRDLLGDDSAPADGFVPEEKALGFNNNASVLGVTALLAEQLKTAAEELARTTDLSQLLKCEPASGTDACATEFIRSFGRRTFRRPLQATEEQRYKAVFSWGNNNIDFVSGIQMVMEAMFQSPHFLYRVELGSSEEVETDVVKLTSWEIANRLSYLIWGSMPDEQLFAAAAANALQSPEQIRAEAERMMGMEKARFSVLSFHTQWLDLDGLDRVDRDAAYYPGYTDAIPDLMRQETQNFVEHVFWRIGDIKTLFTAPYTFVNAELAGFYGLSGPSGAGFEQVDLPASQRAGILTQGSLLTLHAQARQTSPVHRGKFVRERILCDMLNPPPDDLVVQPPDLNPNLTTRERFAEHSRNEFCANCHKYMDSIGLGFEHYDSVGRWRDQENGLAIDASGEVVESDVAGEFNGAVELAAKLAESEQVGRCLINNWVRFAYGRSETAEDACTLERLAEQFKSSSGNMRQLMLELTQTHAFMYRKKIVP